MNSLDMLEKYLMSRDEKYYIPDGDIPNAKIVVFQPYPTADDIRFGVSVSVLKTWQGVNLFDESSSDIKGIVAPVYISNVPLYATDEYTASLTSELEALRCSPTVASEYLKKSFCEKMRAVIENMGVRLVAYKLEIFERFYKDFLDSADPKLVKRLEARLSNGTLKILPFPTYRLDYIEKALVVYNEFKAAFDEAFSENGGDVALTGGGCESIISEDEIIDSAAAAILEKYRSAFEELAK